MRLHDDLGKRMKEYEKVPQLKLTRRTPVIIRIDGKAFHNFTKGFQRPFDDFLIKSMQQTMKYLCENIQGCVLGYHQSDEISLLLVDYKNINTSAWFDNKVQKICSIAASMTTIAFNHILSDNIQDFGYDCCYDPDSGNFGDKVVAGREEGYERFINVYLKALRKGAMFDARCFNIPKEEVANYFYWRQQNAIRNSIQMVGQANFSHKELQNKSCADIQRKLASEKEIDWTDFAKYLQRGSCCIKEKYFVPCENGNYVKYSEGCSDPYSDDETAMGVWRTRWVVDKEIPIFKGEDRNYIDKLVYVGNNK